eukprot:s3280_g3.t1
MINVPDCSDHSPERRRAMGSANSRTLPICCKSSCEGCKIIPDMIMVQRMPVSVPALDLQGSWYTVEGEHIGEINGEQVLWLRSPRVPTTPCSPPRGDYLITPTAEFLIYGTVSLDAQASISWTNGEVWLKK